MAHVHRTSRVHHSRCLRVCTCSGSQFLLLFIFVLVLGSVASADSGIVAAAPPLDLEPFEDDDCFEAPNADILLALMHEMCELLEQILWSKGELDFGTEAWQMFDRWSNQHFQVMVSLVTPVLGRPYCEPGKVAWMAAECLLLLRKGGREGQAEALSCAAALDEDFLTQMTPRAKQFNTRLHLVLRSPWPALRLLDLLVRLHPERGCTRMGACRAFRKWNSDPDIFDWPSFKPLVLTAADQITSDVDLLELKPEDGPLSKQYRTRWMRVYGNRVLREAIQFSDDVFEAYREHHYRAGCHLGVITSYILQMILVHMRDIEGRLQRYAASVAQLMNIHAPFSYMVQSDWPVFRLLYLISLLQRSPPKEVWQGGEAAPHAEADAAKVLCAMVDKAARDASKVVYVTAAWGHLAKYAESVLDRWEGLFHHEPPTSHALIFLALDEDASNRCVAGNRFHGADTSRIHCIDAPRRLGIEGFVAKYLSLAAVTRLGLIAVWLDLDVYIMQDPSAYIYAALSRNSTNASIGAPVVAFAKDLMSESISPAVVVARGTQEATNVLMQYAYWLRENPFLLDHQGWDQFFGNHAGDFSGGFDYQGRNVTMKDDNGPSLSFLPMHGAAPSGITLGFLGFEFGSGDGWRASNVDSLVFFHFWGTDESQVELFSTFYPYTHRGASKSALAVLTRYMRVPSAAPHLAALLGRGESDRSVPGGGGRPLHLVSISYAHGCCTKSLKKNRRQALKVGVDEARAYGFKDLSPSWADRNSEILSQRRGGGWWLWKPKLILQTLQDPSVPWDRGVVIWVDAGNYLQANPRSLAESALVDSDVTALRLKSCLEVDWTNQRSLEQLNVSTRYAVTDRPQLGAYFLMFRKTKVAISFVEDWLKKSEDPFSLAGSLPGEDNNFLPGYLSEVPGFQKHQADQSVFSVLFKDCGFRAISLDQGHRVIKLARWRD